MNGGSALVLVALGLGASLPALGLLVATLGRTPAFRHFAVSASFLAALVLPVGYLIVPGPRDTPAPAAHRGPAPEGVVEPIAEPIDTLRSRLTGGASTADGPRRQGVSASWPATRALLGVWLVGFALLLTRTFAARLRLRRVLRAAGPARGGWDEAARAAVERLVSTGARPPHVRVLAAPVLVPCTAGWWRPVVLVPSAPDDLTAEARQAALLHEFAHVVRRDCLWHSLVRLACALHWWNPVVWAAARCLHLWREQAADDLVVRGGHRPSEYATLLLSYARTGAATLTGSVPLGGPPALARRLRRLLDAKPRSRRPLGRAPALALGLAFLGATVSLSCAGWKKPPRSAAADGDARVSANDDGGPWAVAARAYLQAHGAADRAHAVLETTIETRLQALAEEEVARTARAIGAHAVTLVALEPTTGAVLAMAGVREGSPRWELPAELELPPASTTKPLVFAAALEQQRLPLDRLYPAAVYEQPPYQILDARGRATATPAEILATSSNAGLAFIAQELDAARLGRTLVAFGLSERPGIELEGARAGEIPDLETYPALRVTFGLGEGRATPVQMAAAYAAFGNGGELVAPSLVRRAVDGGRVVWRAGQVRRRVMDPAHAATMLGLLRTAVDHPDATGRNARVEGWSVAGKTGTSDLQSLGPRALAAWFVGLAPADAPRLAVAVAIAVNDEERRYMGATAAAPVFARFVSAALGAPRPAR
jgi:beta-lactamase regulating signal transducer with metallopeptidase domain